MQLNAQNYHITFAGTGESEIVSTVKVENLTAGTSLIINGSDILHLTSIITGISSTEEKKSSELKIYPNPMTDNSTLEIFPPVSGDAVIMVCDMVGKQLAQIQSYLENSTQNFILSGINKGFYLINVKGNGYNFSGKLLSNGKSNGVICISMAKNVHQVDIKSEKTDSKGTQATLNMAYTFGDRLKFTGISGDFSNVKTDIPASDKLVTFNFIRCTDGDNNNYPVVEIGTQVWMAENLKTIKYRNSELIGTTTSPFISIRDEITPKYQWAYSGNEDNASIYGRLYTGYVVTDNRNICPVNWHVPTDNEWITLTSYLTNNGFGFDGNGTAIAKSLAGTTGWNTDPTPGNVGNDPKSNNSSGFTGLPGGWRRDYGEYALLGSLGVWWSNSGAGLRYLEYLYNYVTSYAIDMKMGLSIRCIKDDIATISTKEITEITMSTAVCGGNVIIDGGAPVIARGVCWSTFENPTIALSTKTTDGAGTGEFASPLTGLTPNTTYYIRAYATNGVGTSYGNELSFKTSVYSLQPDLTITGCTYSPLNPTTLDEITFSAVIKNIGNSTADASQLLFKVGGENTPPTFDIPSLDVDQTYSISRKLTLSRALNYQITVTIDPDNQISELNEGNNSFILQVTVTSPPPLALFDNYQGGIIAYILQPGDPGYDADVQHGLIAAPIDQSISMGIQWYNGNYGLIGGTVTDLGSGNSNTNIIVASQGDGNYAAKLCYDLELGGYNDWYLPSLNELYILYLNRSGLGNNFVSNKYWSSSESDFGNAIPVDFVNGNTVAFSKSNYYQVRAVRSF
jgi:uncharacterized protein (TIGR02145 family)